MSCLRDGRSARYDSSRGEAELLDVSAKTSASAEPGDHGLTHVRCSRWLSKSLFVVVSHGEPVASRCMGPVDDERMHCWCKVQRTQRTKKLLFTPATLPNLLSNTFINE